MITNNKAKQNHKKNCLLKSFLQLIGLWHKYSFIWVGGVRNAEIYLFVEFSLSYIQSQVQTPQTELSSIPHTEMFLSCSSKNEVLPVQANWSIWDLAQKVKWESFSCSSLQLKTDQYIPNIVSCYSLNQREHSGNKVLEMLSLFCMRLKRQWAALFRQWAGWGFHLVNFSTGSGSVPKRNSL